MRMSYEEHVLKLYSTPGLRKNEVSRASKKWNMEFDPRFRDMSKQDREAFLDEIYGPEQSCRRPIENR